MKLRPLRDRVLIRRAEQEGKTSGGLIIPDTAQEKPVEGDVVAVGSGARGDRVLFGKWSGTEIKIDGEDLIIMTEGDVMGVIDQTGANKKAA